MSDQLGPLPHLRLGLDERGVLSVWLNRPERRNAMNGALVSALMGLFKALKRPEDPLFQGRQVRLCTLRGEGGVFSSGGDVEEMMRAQSTELQTLNRSFGDLLLEAQSCPVPLICIVEGAAMGGGFGLVSVSDFCLSMSDARFALPEVRLGLIPAQIAPFVARRVGLQRATQLALAGAPISGVQAVEMGLVSESFNSLERLHARLEELISQLLRGAPNALKLTKELLQSSQEASGRALSELLDQASQDFSHQVSSLEGQEGIQAYLNKRAPLWRA